jgi:hypothetical protein
MINKKIFYQLNLSYNQLLLRICFHRSYRNPKWKFSLSHLSFRPIVTCDNPEDYPESYRTNSEKEKLILTFVENFRRQYHYIYRDRKPLFLNPINECGVPVNIPHIKIFLFSLI